MISDERKEDLITAFWFCYFTGQANVYALCEWDDGSNETWAQWNEERAFLAEYAGRIGRAYAAQLTTRTTVVNGPVLDKRPRYSKWDGGDALLNATTADEDADEQPVSLDRAIEFHHNQLARVMAGLRGGRRERAR